MTRRRKGLAPMLVALVTLTPSVAGGQADLVDRDVARQWGPAALFALLRIEGARTTIEEVAAHLPPARPAGHSMAELRDAARALGYRLEGIAIGKQGDTIDRPVLAFLRVETGGHFVLIRPVGHTGHLVQVIDADQAPHIMDRSDRVTSHQWTGYILIPKRARWPTLLEILLGGASVVGLIAIASSRSPLTWHPLALARGGRGAGWVPTRRGRAQPEVGRRGRADRAGRSGCGASRSPKRVTT